MLQEFEWICPQEMPKQQGTVFDKTLNAIRVQTALNPLRVSIAREEEFHTKVEKLLVPKNLGKEGKEIRRKLLAAKTEDARRELLLEFDEGWFENQLKMFWRELQKFLPRTSLEDAIMRSGGAAPSSLPPPESFTAAKAKSRNGDQPAPAPAPAVLPVQAPAKAPASAQAPAAAPQRSTNLTPWQLKRLTLRIIESGRGVSKNAGVHETFVDMYQQATKEVKELLARRPLGDGSAADTKQEAASAKVDAATEKPKSSRAGAPLRAQPVAAKAPAASKATTVLPLASKPAAPSATTSGKDKEPAPVTQEPTASPPPQKRKRAQPVEDTDSDSDEDAMPPPTRGRRAAASAAAGAGAAANKENTQPAAPAASAIQALVSALSPARRHALLAAGVVRHAYSACVLAGPGEPRQEAQRQRHRQGRESGSRQPLRPLRVPALANATLPRPAPLGICWQLLTRGALRRRRLKNNGEDPLAAILEVATPPPSY